MPHIPAEVNSINLTFHSFNSKQKRYLDVTPQESTHTQSAGG